MSAQFDYNELKRTIANKILWRQNKSDQSRDQEETKFGRGLVCRVAMKRAGTNIGVMPQQYFINYIASLSALQLLKNPECVSPHPV